MTAAQRRGAELLACELAEILGEFGWSSSVIALSPGPRELEIPTLGARTLGVSTLAKLRPLMHSASVVVAHGSSTLPACAIAGFGLTTPFVYRSVGDPRYWAPTSSKRLRTACLLRRAKRVVALTSEAAASLESRYGVRPKSIAVIPKAVDASRVLEVTPERRRAAREALHIPEGVSVALYLGALTEEKNPTMAIEAAGQLRALHLIVAGSGRQRERLGDVAERCAAGRVHFVGSVAEPAELLAASEVLLLPSRTEGMPGAAIEAGLAGLPVVATDVGWVREIVVDGATGVIVPTDDTERFAAGIVAALAAAAVLGKAARSRCLAHFDMRRVAQRWDALLSEVTNDVG